MVEACRGRPGVGTSVAGVITREEHRGGELEPGVQAVDHEEEVLVTTDVERAEKGIHGGDFREVGGVRRRVPAD